MKVLVTGSASMIGRAICDQLKMKNYEVDELTHNSCDLLRLDEVHSYFNSSSPDMVIHAAGYNGGIEWNRRYPATIFQKTVQMGLNVLDMCAYFKVSKVLSIISSCAYPDQDAEELQEETFWNGLPNQSVECHGLAKRMLNAYSRQISKEYDTVAITAVLNNSYGPWDSYHPQKTKVVGGMVKRFVDARDENLPFVTCWGSGSPLREFVYCKDAGDLLVKTLEVYSDTSLPLNLSSGSEVSIRELAETTAKIAGYNGEIRWDDSKPDGQLRKKLNIDRMKEILFDQNLPQFTSLEQGLKETVEWYENWKRCTC